MSELETLSLLFLSKSGFRFLIVGRRYALALIQRLGQLVRAIDLSRKVLENS